MKSYIKPEFKVNVFSVDDVITSPSVPFAVDAKEGQKAVDQAKTVDYTEIFK